MRVFFLIEMILKLLVGQGLTWPIFFRYRKADKYRYVK